MKILCILSWSYTGRKLLLPLTIAFKLEQINQYMLYNLTWKVISAEGDIINSACKVVPLDSWFPDLRFSGVHL